jgi:transposase
MAASSMARAEATALVVGVDTHKDVHVARAKDTLGRLVGERSVPAPAPGFRELLGWARTLGEVISFGIEGTGSYGAGLTRYLRREGVAVVEVIRPNRQARRRNGKSDPADADAAASAVLSGEASGVPKSGQAHVEMIRSVRVVRQTAVKARTQAINAMHALVVTAPEELRDALRGMRGPRLVRVAASFRPGPLTDPTSATKAGLRSLARRHQELAAEIKALEADLARLTQKASPRLHAIYGAGTDIVGALLVAAGDNPERLRSESSFSMLCGASPLEASSGKTKRHRLNRGGDRKANEALWRIVMVRLRQRHGPTVSYLDRRTSEGKSKREIIRCLKRYVAREVFAALIEDSAFVRMPRVCRSAPA